MKKFKMFGVYRMWLWFVLVTIILSLFIILITGSLELKKDIKTGASIDEYKGYVNKRIPKLMKRYSIPGCNIAIVKDGEIAWLQSYGYADLASARALTIDTPMSVQSITKSITAWGVMKLSENGLVNLDDPVSEYLKTWQFPTSDYQTDKITIRQLLSHTSGMPLGDFTNIYYPGEVGPTNREVITYEAQAIREPGSKFSYSNVGYNILEILIEDVSGQSYAEYIKTEVLQPLGMNSSFFEIDGSISPYPPTGYNLKKKSVPVYLYPSKASGGMFSTAEDIARFALASMKENPVLNSHSINQMYQLECQKIGIYGLVFDGYGLGHYIERLPNGAISVSHGGQGNGIMTHLQIVPETGDAIVILTNSQRSWPFISYLLTDWAEWRGFPSVGMGRIIWGHYGLSVLIGIIVSAILQMVLRLTLSFYHQKKTGYRMLRVFASAFMIVALIWCICQDYLFLTSVFPVLSIWLGGAVFVFAIVLLLSVIKPVRSNKKL